MKFYKLRLYSTKVACHKKVEISDIAIIILQKDFFGVDVMALRIGSHGGHAHFIALYFFVQLCSNSTRVRSVTEVEKGASSQERFSHSPTHRLTTYTY